MAVAQAQTAAPDLKGTWRGDRKSIAMAATPIIPARRGIHRCRIRDIDVTYVTGGRGVGVGIQFLGRLAGA